MQYLLDKAVESSSV